MIYKHLKSGIEYKVEDYIRSEIKKYNTVCFPLMDSESSLEAASIARNAEKIGASANLVGGSSTVDQFELTEVISSIKSQIKIPVILFPGNVTGVSPKADAILFSSLLNSESPYLIIGEGTTAWYVGKARGIPFDKSRIAIMYSLAAQYLGMRFLYLEAGSGAVRNVSPQMVSAVRKHYTGILIVGGGIRTPETAKEIANAGADAIVIGTMIEKDG